jgi:hypothetical protein
MFILMQLLGGVVGLAVIWLLYPDSASLAAELDVPFVTQVRVHDHPTAILRTNLVPRRK